MLRSKYEKLIKDNPSGWVVLIDGEALPVSELEERSWISHNVVSSVVEKEPLSLSGSVDFGADPEVFIVKNKKVVPSENVIPPQGLMPKYDNVVRDGFQAELHPRKSYCRQLFANKVEACLMHLRNSLGEGMSISKAVSIKVSEDVFFKASPTMRQFGCSPSSNPYEDTEVGDGQEVRQRSAGGHLHFSYKSRYGRLNQKKIVKVMDIVLGNTCVLIDRDKGNAIRRELYGRAGEYRNKSYGLEYRVPSNFWLQHYLLLSMVTALGRQAIQIVKGGHADEFLKLFDTDSVRKAINTNDKRLARKNFNIYKKWLKDNHVISNAGITHQNVDKFEAWSKHRSPIKSLIRRQKNTSLNYGNNPGFESFLENYKF